MDESTFSEDFKPIRISSTMEMSILKDKKEQDLDKYNGNNNTDDTMGLRLQRILQYVVTSLKYKVVIMHFIYLYIIHPEESMTFRGPKAMNQT